MKTMIVYCFAYILIRSDMYMLLVWNTCTVENRYNKVLETMDNTLLYQGKKTKDNIELGPAKSPCCNRCLVISELFIMRFHCTLFAIEASVKHTHGLVKYLAQSLDICCIYNCIVDEWHWLINEWSKTIRFAQCWKFVTQPYWFHTDCSETKSFPFEVMSSFCSVWCRSQMEPTSHTLILNSYKYSSKSNHNNSHAGISCRVFVPLVDNAHWTFEGHILYVDWWDQYHNVFKLLYFPKGSLKSMSWAQFHKKWQITVFVISYWNPCFWLVISRFVNDFGICHRKKALLNRSLGSPNIIHGCHMVGSARRLPYIGIRCEKALFWK